MAKKKKTQKPTRIKKAVAASVERSKERAKIDSGRKERQEQQTDLRKKTTDELIMMMGKHAYKLGDIQERIGLLAREDKRLQEIVQRIKKELDKRSLK